MKRRSYLRLWEQALFTGIIEQAGIVKERHTVEAGARLHVLAPGLAGAVSIGDSVSVNGVCLTVVAVDAGAVQFDVVEETLQRSTLGCLGPGSRVNLELPVSLESLLGGHLVQGHVDAVGIVRSVETRGIERWITIGTPAPLLRYIVEKGSIAADGVSLTVAAVDSDSFAVAIIPHTAKQTTLGDCRPGSRVNLETDIIAKHLEKLAAPYLLSAAHPLSAVHP